MTKVILRLPSSLDYCPKYWQNFIMSFPRIEYGGVALSVLNRELKKYRAKYIETRTQGDYVRFDDEQALMWFKLKWM